MQSRRRFLYSRSWREMDRLNRRLPLPRTLVTATPRENSVIMLRWCRVMRLRMAILRHSNVKPKLVALMCTHLWMDIKLG